MVRRLFSGQVSVVAIFVSVLVCHRVGAAQDECVPTLEGRRGYEAIGIQGGMPMSQALRCLNSLTINGPEVYNTLKHLEQGVLRVYSFTKINADSQHGNNSFADGCNMPRHQVNVDMAAVLDGMEVAYTVKFGVTDFEELLHKEDTTVSAYDFHENISALFHHMFDAHTMYEPPYFRFYEYVEPEDKIPVGLKLTAATGEDDPPIVHMSTDEERQIWRVVAKIDGKDAFEWLKEDSTHQGQYKSAGARLNANMNQWAQGFHYYRAMPQKEDLPIVFENGDALALKAIWYTRAENKKDLQELNGRWTRLRQWLKNELELTGEERREAQTTLKISAAEEDWAARSQRWFDVDSLLFAAGAPTRGTFPNPEVELDAKILAATGHLAERRRRTSLPGNLPRHDQEAEDITSRRMQDEPDMVRVAAWPDWDKPIFAGYRIEDTDTVVLKVTAFMPPTGGADDDELAAILGIVGVFPALFLVHQRLAEAVGDGTGNGGRLILDLSDNGGGIVDLANVLIALVAPRSSGSHLDLCSRYSVRMNTFWQLWLESFGGRWDAVAARIDALSRDELDDLVERFSNLQDLPDLIDFPVPLNMEAVALMEAEVEAADSLVDKRRVLQNHIVESQDVFQTFMPGVFSTYLPDLWFPFNTEVRDPKDGGSVWMGKDPYLNTRERDWGSGGNYSQEYIFACEMAFIDAIQDIWFLLGYFLYEGTSYVKAKHQWSEIAILTNGLCGSACSLAATKLQFSEGATMFTYGGIPGELMDTSAFAGGNVLGWAEHWPSLLYAALIGDNVYGKDTAIGQRLRRSGSAERLYADTLQLPLPTKAITRFNYNMMFGAEFSTDDTMPREFINIPAHKHYNEWHATNPGKPSTWAPLQQMYVKIMREDWAALRARGKNGGIGGGVEYGCAKDVPTEPWVQEVEPRDASFRAVITLFLWVVGCCLFCCCCFLPVCCCVACCYCTKPRARTPPFRSGADVQLTQTVGGPQPPYQQEQYNQPQGTSAAAAPQYYYPQTPAAAAPQYHHPQGTAPQQPQAPPQPQGSEPVSFYVR